MLFAWSQDESEGQYATTFFSETYTVLFEHIYDNNKTGALLYKAKINEASPEKTVSLDYTEDEANKWSKEERSFIDSWSVNNDNDFIFVANVLTNIKTANHSEKITPMEFEKDRIYISKLTLDGEDYPIAVYANKASLTELRKKVVEDADVLEDKGNIEYIYCDENYLGYLILAFYEGKASKPSLIIQIEKFVGDDTKEKWLNYLGIVGEPNVDDEIREILTSIKYTNVSGNETCKIKQYGVKNNFVDYDFKLDDETEIKISILKKDYPELTIQALKKECGMLKGADEEEFGESGSYTTFTFYGDYKGTTISDLLVITVDDEYADKLEEYLFPPKQIVIRVTRTSKETNRTVGTIDVDNGAITGFTLELPRGTDEECKTSCPKTIQLGESTNTCHCIVEGTFNFTVTTSSDNTNHINKSLRLANEDTEPRASILIHRGQYARGWSRGCVIAVPKNPMGDVLNNYSNNTEESMDFCIEIVNYVNQQENAIKALYKVDEVKKIVIIQ